MVDTKVWCISKVPLEMTFYKRRLQNFIKRGMRQNGKKYKINGQNRSK